MQEYSALRSSFEQIQEQLAKTVVGQEDVVEQLMISLLAGGHCLFEGAPGAARALTAAQLSTALGLTFARVCCTNELTPEELVGADWEPEPTATVGTAPGPLFANVVFLDDVLRLAPKTAALVQQAITDREVFVRGRAYKLADPQVVLAATYTDYEPEGPPEPRDDRYLMKISIEFPSYQDEYQIAQTASGPIHDGVEAVLSPEQLVELRRQVREVEVPPYVLHYALRLVRATRVHECETPDFVYEWLQAGAGTRAAHALALTGKVRAALHGRGAADCADVQAVALPVLRHRLETNHNARSNGVTVDRVISRLLYEVPDRVPDDEAEA